MSTHLLATWAALTSSLVWAGQTRTWLQSDYADFEKGDIKNLSLRSDGVLTLAPQFRERFDSSSAYLWAIAQDSKQNLYTGGGPGAKLYRVSPNGDSKALAELDALEIHAIAVDKKDRVFVATSPDGKVYSISPSGKAEVFYEPKTKYIWAMTFDSKGNLFLATGDQGEIHRVSPDGKGSVFFKNNETHVRSITVDAADNLIVGTDPSGLVLRISPAGEGFVLYQMAKREITAVAVARDGSIYAAGVGSKQSPAVLPSPPPVTSLPAPAPMAAGVSGPIRAISPPPPTFPSGGPVAISGGTELYRIDKSGNPRKLWSHSEDIVYTIGFDPAGHVLLGAGNKGFIYRIDSDTTYTALLNAPPTQITAFLSGRDGKVYAATGNVGKIYEIGRDLEKQGWIESTVLDASMFSQWGRLVFKSSDEGGSISLVTRSGNLDQPQKNWSPWSKEITVSTGTRITSPPARFLQWKVTLSSQDAKRSPKLEWVEVSYLPRNVEPRIEAVEITPANYRFPLPTPASTSRSLSLPPMGKRPQITSTPTVDSNTPTMQFAKGFIGARWSAVDENGDTLVFNLQIRGAQESEWKPLKDNVREKYFSWDSTAYPDGEYRLRVIASDLPSNPREMALSTQFESEEFLIDNTPPKISALQVSRSGKNLQVRWKAADALSVIKKAEYSLDGGEWMAVASTTYLSDSPELDYSLTVENVTSGEHVIAVRVDDEYDNQATEKVMVR